jgi:hypothetical protein
MGVKTELDDLHLLLAAGLTSEDLPLSYDS